MAYTITYFDIRGLGEVPRLVLSAAGQQFVDDRIPFRKEADGSWFRGDWEERKKKAPYGQVPLLTLEDGTVIAQSGAIVRFLARRHGLAGTSDVEGALIDAAYESMQDLRKAYFTAKSDNGKAAEFWSKGLPEGLAYLNKNVAGDVFFAKSNQLSFADISIYYSLWVLQTENAEAVEKALAGAPKIKAIFEAVPKVENIAAYLKSRKETPM